MSGVYNNFLHRLCIFVMSTALCMCMPRPVYAAVSGDESAPEDTPVITYASCVADGRMSGYKSLGKKCGGTKEALPICAITMNLSQTALQGTVQYRLCKEDGKYGKWVKAGNIAGTEGSGDVYARMKIRLTGELAEKYDIYYRVCIQNYGWLGWAKNGQNAGGHGFELYITGFQVKLAEKDAEVTWSTKAHDIKAAEQTYVIKVNKAQNCVTVYLGKKPIKAFICSTGKNTPLGTFRTTDKYRWRLLIRNEWGQYATRIVKRILFHSVPYNSKDAMDLRTQDYNKLGTGASAGCVRLTVRDAKWIYDNCGLRTKVVIYKDKNPGPLGKPSFEKIPKDQKWDPTDTQCFD